VIGIVEDHDLVALESRSSFFMRRAAARAGTVDELVAASSKLLPAIVSMTRAHMAALDVMSVFSVVADALTRRALELAVAEAGEPPERFAWLALGSQARREAMPSSDLDSAIVWFGGEGGDAGAEHERSIRPYLDSLATTVTDTLVRCGFRPDSHRASASDPLFVRSLASWQRAARSLLENPTQDKAQILVSVLVDSRSVWGADTGPLIADTFQAAPEHPAMLRLLAEFALSHKPPTGFLRGRVVEFSGEHRGRFDLKHGGVVPIADLARWAGMTAGVTCASTTERLRVAGEVGTLSSSDSLTLQDAFELVCELRLEHQVAQLESGAEPDDIVDAATLSPLTRSYLKEAFRAVASVQRRITNDLILALR